MAKTDVDTVDAYIARQPQDVQRVLKRVRSIIRKAVPGGEEVISYAIPAYKLRGNTVLFFAGWKEHYSLYPAGEELDAEFKGELARYKRSKGTVRFPLSEPIPAKLIERIAKFRAKRIAESEKAKAPKKRSTTRA